MVNDFRGELETVLSNLVQEFVTTTLHAIVAQVQRAPFGEVMAFSAKSDAALVNRAPAPAMKRARGPLPCSFCGRTTRGHGVGAGGAASPGHPIIKWCSRPKCVEAARKEKASWDAPKTSKRGSSAATHAPAPTKKQSPRKPARGLRAKRVEPRNAAKVMPGKSSIDAVEAASPMAQSKPTRKSAPPPAGRVARAQGKRRVSAAPPVPPPPSQPTPRVSNGGAAEDFAIVNRAGDVVARKGTLAEAMKALRVGQRVRSVSTGTWLTQPLGAPPPLEDLDGAARRRAFGDEALVDADGVEELEG